MSNEPRSSNSHGQTPKRFARLVEGKPIGTFFRKRVWKQPKFSVRQTKTATEFKFTFPFSVPQKFKYHRPRLHDALFEPKEARWTKALVRAYSHKSPKDKSLKQWFGIYLYKVFQGAFRILMQDTVRSLGEGYSQWENVEFAELRRETTRKRGPRKSRRKREQRATEKKARQIRLAKRYEELKPQVENLREYIKKEKASKSLTETALREEIKKRFAFDWVGYVTDGTALRNYQDNFMREKITLSLGSLKWAVWSLTLSIMICEEKSRNPRLRLRPRTLYEKYILPGEKHLKVKFS